MKESERGSDGAEPTARGRRASRAELRSRLSSAAAAYLVGALHNPALTLQEMVLLLRNRQATPDLLAAVGRDPRWTRSYRVKVALVRHPHTPHAVAQRLVGHLRWADAAETTRDTRLNPALRRQAERLIRGKLPELAQGERVTLARRACSELIEDLRACGEAKVLTALLGNPQLKQGDAVAIANDASAPGEVLERLARHSTWGRLGEVRRALVHNARTPVPTALRLLAGLSAGELEELAEDESAPTIVRVRAQRQLDESRRRTGGRRS